MEFFGMTGERLGNIGISDKKPEEADRPQWQRDFLSKPSISIRKGIAWSYGTPYEDTDTLVLTAPSSRFVDIRLPKECDPSKPLADHVAFWAFTGTATTTFAGTQEAPMMHVAHSVWKHDIDSQGQGISDEGDLFVLPNGDCAEVGMMKNPNSGKVEMYKEYWTSPPPGLDGETASKPCVVAEIVDYDSSHDKQSVWRGLLIRAGDYCQGILESGAPGSPEVCSVGRWTRSRRDRDWIQDPRNAFTIFAHSTAPVSQNMPFLWACEESRREGDETTCGNLKWRITEVLR